MTNREILKKLQSQGFLPQLAQAPPHLTATEQTAAALPSVNTHPAAFEPMPEGQNLQAAPQQAELIAMSKGETAVRFSDPRMSFQQAGLLVRRRSEAVSKLGGQVAEANAAVNRIVDDANAALQKRQRESGEWPQGFTSFGDMRRCDACQRAFWTVRTAWTHLQRGCPEKVRIARALAEYRPATMG